MTDAISKLTPGLIPTTQGSAALTLPSQLEAFRAAYLHLAALYQEAGNTRQTHQALLDLADQRLAALAPELLPQVKPKFTSFCLLHSRIFRDQEHQSLQPLRGLHTEIKALVSDPALLTTLDLLLTESEAQGPKLATIRDQEQRLDLLSTTFTRTAQTTTNAIGQRLAQKQAQVHGLVLALFTAMAGVLLLFFLVSSRTLHTFKNGLVQARAFIGSRPGADPPPPAADDEVTGFIHALQALSTTLTQTRMELGAAHSRMEELSATIPDWLWMIDAQGICTYSRHPIAQEEEGLAPDQRPQVGQPLAQILARCIDNANGSPLQAALVKQHPFDHLQDAWHCTDGRTIPFLSWGRPMMDHCGQFAGFIVISRDISGQQQTEMALAKASHASTLLNQVLELALLDTTIPELMDRFLGLLINRTWLNTQPSAAFFLIDRSRNALVMTAQRGLDLDTRRACNVLPLGTCLCGRVARTGKVIFADSGDDRHEMSYHGMAIHGHYCLPVHTVAGEIIGVVVLYLNANSWWDRMDESILVNATTMIGSIIRRRQAEDGLKQLNQELERRIDSRTAQLTAANQELDAFAYSVSHDLRAPLRAVDGFTQALTEDFGSALPPEAQGYLERIRSGCSRMGALIDDILRLSRLTRTDLQWQPLDLSAMAMEIIEEIKTEAPQRMVEWRIAADLTTEADPAMMRAVLDNLLANAWKYSAKTLHATIEFGRADLDHEAAFFVKDNGAGFDMRYSDKLFKAFQRLHPSNQFTGNGIGLATVQRIIHRHGGRIWAEAQVDAGATFYFTLGRPDRAQRGS
jgi:signal transduction histidine kinase/PAS domain-containing protein